MKLKKIISRLLLGLLIISLVIGIPLYKVNADSFIIVTLGADLSDQQKDEMLKYFNVTKEDVSITEITIEEESKYLSSVAPKEQIGNRSISCSYIEPTSSGGLNISLKNLTWVDENMIRNALITAGIENANVKVGAPFKVSGTAALTGIIKGFESSSKGEKIDEDKKIAATEELVVTGQLGDKIGKDKAAGLINEIKREVIKEKPKTEGEIKEIVEDITDSYNYSLSKEDIDKITALMVKINDLGLDFKKLQNQLNNVASKLKETLESDKAKTFFSQLWDSIKNYLWIEPKEDLSGTDLGVTLVFSLLGILAILKPDAILSIKTKNPKKTTINILRIIAIIIIANSAIILFKALS
ncbi:putative secreted protein [Clostridium sp. N3C]|nr:putative secreted protein [Clostridium sp. N3C]